MIDKAKTLDECFKELILKRGWSKNSPYDRRTASVSYTHLVVYLLKFTCENMLFPLARSCSIGIPCVSTSISIDSFTDT